MTITLSLLTFVGPIDLVRLNIHTGTTELFEETDNDRAHRKRERANYK